MSQKETNFFNIDAMEQGIARTLVEGITTRIFPGDQSNVISCSHCPKCRWRDP